MSHQRRGSVNKRTGSAAEEVFRSLLLLLGVELAELVHDSYIPIRQVGPRQFLCTKGAKKLAGDVQGYIHRAHVVLESKSRPSKLTYSDLQSHQHDRLSDFRRLGHAPLVGWRDATTNRYWILPYDGRLFRPRLSFGPMVADRWAIERPAQLVEWAKYCAGDIDSYGPCSDGEE